MALEFNNQKALDALKKQQADKRQINLANAVKEIKGTKFFEENWNDLL